MFLIYVNDLDTGILSKISKFADDTKLCHVISSDTDRQEVQEDLDTLVSWANEWQMSFNVSKCAVLHIGHNNPCHRYSMNGEIVGAVNRQRDLGILVSKDLKWEHQVNASYAKANRMLGLISRNFTYRSKEIMLPLYKSLVRPHLEHAVQLWSPHLQRDINKLERIQHRATKLIPELKQLPYERRLGELNLITLRQRRLRGRLIETYKYLHEFVDVDYTTVYERNDRQNGDRNNNGQKLFVKRAETDVRHKFFPLNIVGTWNRLPREVVEAESVNSFKNRLDLFWEQQQ